MANTNKPFHGRAIYQPSGAAGEYSQWACNLFNGLTPVDRLRVIGMVSFYFSPATRKIYGFNK